MFDFVSRYLTKVKRKGYLIYVGIVVASLIYVMYSVSNLPTVGPPPKDSKDGKVIKKQKKGTANTSNDKKDKKDKKDNNTDITLDLHEELNTTLTEDEVTLKVKTWSKRELYGYLIQEKIYLDINADIEDVRRQVVQVYLAKQNH